jgi:pilus assembly protein CpaB
MSVRTILVITCALVFGGTAAMGVHLGLSKGDGAGANMATIVVATANVPRGETVTTESVVARPYPKDLLPEGVITKVEDAVGRAAYVPLVKDEPLVEGKLAPKGAGRGLAALIKHGYRAITVQTPNVATGVAGFIVPGNKVDVLMTFNDRGPFGVMNPSITNLMGGPPPQEHQEGGTITLLENVEILAVDQKVDAPAENRMDANQMRSVTLLVTPEDAAKLTLGQNKGTIHLSLRSSSDAAKVASHPKATVSDLFSRGGSWEERARLLLAGLARASVRPPAPKGPPGAAPAPAQPPRLRTIRTFRGTREGMIHLGPADAKRPALAEPNAS